MKRGQPEIAGIGSFLVRGEDAKALTQLSRDENHCASVQPAKRRKVDEGGIQDFFGKRENSHEDSGEYSDPTEYEGPDQRSSSPHGDNALVGVHDEDEQHNASLEAGEQKIPDVVAAHQSTIPSYFCDRCKKALPATAKDEHDDWHFAKDLQAHDQAPGCSGACSKTCYRQSHYGLKEARAAKDECRTGAKAGRKGTEEA